MATHISPENPILIIGAGITGLTLAQSLKKENFPFRIFERDAFVDSRSPGWGLTIYWARAALESCLPTELWARIGAAQVDPAQGRNDSGRFLFLDLSTASPRYAVKSTTRLRLNRRKFRALLLDGLLVEWGKSLENFSESDGGVDAVFADGTAARGSLLIGADGSNSKTRSILCPDTWSLNLLPVRFLGVALRLTASEIEPLRAFDPLLFNGCHPVTGTYMWFSVLSTPESNGSSGPAEYFEAQINISWRVKCAEDEAPRSNRERLGKLKALARPFEQRLRTTIESIPEGTEVLELKLQDWPDVRWPNGSGKATLIGDAAHAMTMYRGEATNHGITDALRLRDALKPIVEGQKQQISALAEFQEEVRERAGKAVLLSRQACLDAHDWEGLTDDSPLVAARTMALTSATAVTL